MRAGGRPKSYKNGARWVNARGGRRKAISKEETPKQEANPNAIYDSDGDGKTDFIGWILYGPNPQISDKFMWIATILGLIYIYLKYS